MNGVRRLLGAATTSTSSSPPSAGIDSPLSAQPFSARPLNGPSWPPPSPSTATPPTPPLSFKKELAKKNIQFELPSRNTNGVDTSEPNTRSSSGSPSSSRVPFNRPTHKLGAQSKSFSDTEWKKTLAANNSQDKISTRDELLLSLLASQAVVDSRDFEILSSEQIDDLTKEHQALMSRLEAMSKKLTLETKIRDAALSLSKVNSTHKKGAKQTDEQLEAANRRVAAAQQEFWRISERAQEVYRRVLEHRAGVLSFSVRSLEQKANSNNTGEDSGYDSNRSTLMSPTTTGSLVSSSSPAKSRFDGPHLFAGHANTVVPRAKPPNETAAAEIVALEEKLKAATASLTAAGKKQVELTRELSMMKLEKQEVETLMGMDLQSAEEKIKAFEDEIPRFRQRDVDFQELFREKLALEDEKVKLLEQTTQVEVLKAKLNEAEVHRGMAVNGSAQEITDIKKLLEDKYDEIRRITAQWHAEREVWERQKAQAEDEKMEDLARLQQEMDDVRDEDQNALRQAHEELDTGLEALQSLVKHHGIVLFSRDPSLQGLLSSIGTHLETVHTKLESYARTEGEWETVRRKLEDDIRSGLDKREALARELEEVRRERDNARNEARTAERSSISNSRQSPELSTSDSAGRVVQVLMPLWNILPSPEARAAKFNRSRQFRAGSPTLQREANGPSKAVASLSELDVRSLKSLYESTKQPASPVIGGGDFSIEAFASRVQALIQDDRALIERLLRFAQAHDLLKKNAERAQKLAQEGNTAMETYQKQVRTLEERNMAMASKQAALLEDVQQLQSAVERIEKEKQEVEALLAEQAETCQQLTEANNTLSARTLALAEEAASAPEMVRKQLEAELLETRAALEKAEDEVEAMRTSEQSQRIALLDELNSMQTENTQLRAQLRARK